MSDRTSTSSNAVPCEPDPDVAGIGIVASFLITAWLTAILSILAIIWHDKATTLTFLGHLRIKYSFSRRVSLVLGATISGLDVTQFATSIGMLIALIATYPNSKDPHALLAVGLTILAASSQLLSLAAAAIIDELHAWTLMLRGLVGIVQSMIVLVLFFTWYFDGSSRTGGIFATICVVNATIRFYPPFFALLALVEQVWRTRIGRDSGRDSGHDSRHESRIILWTILQGFYAMGVIFYGLLATSLATYAVVDLKWNHATCDMTSGDDQSWSFGQSLALSLLVAVLVTALDAGNEDGYRRFAAALADRERRRRTAIAIEAGPTATQTTLDNSHSTSARRSTGDLERMQRDQRANTA